MKSTNFQQHKTKYLLSTTEMKCGFNVSLLYFLICLIFGNIFPMSPINIFVVIAGIVFMKYTIRTPIDIIVFIISSFFLFIPLFKII